MIAKQNYLVKRNILFFVVFLIVFCVFSYFRFYHLDKRVIFDWDQERDATVIRTLFKEHKFTLLGPRVLGPEGFFLAPYFTYVLAPFYFLTNLHPSAMIYFLVFYNVLFFVTAYFVLKKIFDFSTALVFLFIWGVGSGFISMDTTAWNPVFAPLIVIVVWGLLSWDSKDRKTYLKWLILGFTLGLGINFHFQIIFLIPFIIVYLLSAFAENHGLWPWMNVKNFLLRRISLPAEARYQTVLGEASGEDIPSCKAGRGASFQEGSRKIAEFTCVILGLLFTLTPLLLFDMRHNFLNLRLFFNFVFGQTNRGKDVASWFPVWRNVSRGFGGFDFSFFPVVFYIFIFGVMIYLAATRKDKKKRIFFTASSFLWMMFPLGFSIFGNRPSEYYFNFIYPFLLVSLIVFFKDSILKIVIGSLIFISIFLSQYPLSQQLLKTNPRGLFFKEMAVSRIKKIGEGKNFNVSYSVPIGRDTGYSYLLDYYQVKQSGNFNDNLIRILIPPEKNNERQEIFGGIGIIIPKNF